eukprot:TRINITY_DN66474_c6_g4_i1.p1 TRINITY_DN66474_c6_g4~~TRINITY_DN66474_c6_g4_i1.p1  ORF type:complete len:247 (+),score=27.71 TRINITY_DN66474_c6_g4_i1:32-772(+)
MSLQLFTAPTPNGHKISIMLEELGVPYTVTVVSLNKKEQFEPDFLKVSPNGKIPAIIDHANGGHTVFESGAILLYLAERYGRFLPSDAHQRSTVIQWLFWQMANLGPMVGQAITFNRFVQEPKERIEYSQHRYTTEARRLLEVLDKQLEGKEYMCGELSIADFASFPWARAHKMAKVRIDGLKNVEAWLARMKARPAVRKGLSIGFPKGREELAQKYSRDQPMNEAEKKRFFAEGRQNVTGQQPKL